MAVALGIVVLGAAVTWVVAQQTSAVSENDRADFVEQFRHALIGFETFHQDTRNYPPHTPPGDVPPGMDSYLKDVKWTQPTPIGGWWTSVQDNTHGVRVSAIAVTYGKNEPLPVLQQLLPLDSVLDDGDLNTGVLRFDPEQRRLVYLVSTLP